MISYNYVLGRVRAYSTIAMLAAIEQERTGEIPGWDVSLDDGQLAGEVMCAVERLFPIYNAMPDSCESLAEIFDVPPDHYMLCMGYDWERSFDQYSDVERLMVCVFCLDTIHADEADCFLEWWHDLCDELPEPDKINLVACIDNLRNTADLPAPYNGLYALLRWMEADTGNPFVDINIEEQGYSYGVMDWCEEDIRMLADYYAEADRDIFEPVRVLERCAFADPAVLPKCVALVLGADYTVIDGELIISGDTDYGRDETD